MATTIKLKNGSGAPLAGDLVQGEPALDLTNKRLYTEDSGGTVIEVGTNPTSLTTGTFTSTGIDDNATSTAITIDASENVGINTASPSSVLDVRLTGATGDVAEFHNNAGFGVRFNVEGNGGTNTIFSESNQSLALGTNGSGNPRVTITSSGNVGIGNLATNAKLEVTATSGEVFRADASGGAYRIVATQTGVNLNGNVGIGTSSPTNNLDVGFADLGSGSIGFRSSTYSQIAKIVGSHDSGTAEGSLRFHTRSGGSEPEHMRITSSGNVGIGESAPQYKLDINGTNTAGNVDVAAFTNPVNAAGTGHGARILIHSTQNPSRGVGIASVSTSNYAADNAMAFYTSASSTLYERMRLSSSGRFSINNTTNAEYLRIKGENGNQFGLDNDGSTFTQANFYTNGTLNGALWVDSAKAEFAIYAQDELTFYSGGNSSTARATIDSSGNLLVGTTSGSYKVTCNGSGYFNYTVVNNGAVYNSFTNASGITFSTTGTRPTNNAGTPTDNTFDLGDASIRWDDVYATNGTIQTSDANDKQDIEALSEAETRVAVAAKALLRKFRWKSAVEEKGDEARIHFGIIAQDLKAAFEAEGLDAGRYAMFIHSTWTDEETGEERSRMGVRYSELLAFIIAAI